ncbi:hypothetical protein [Dechloromonas sp. HYN0024]|uniref:hypothetical protein n=1 Tax=Dechloromonas sp. HYN0024 TaxID=2231055 RepID=UPI000E44469E|nr:hypothetical protein [Dechloromonas sp. HYN0024]AXS78671.1 hypothetical protein HYN24_00625 [Dechloromonas sp. HYN0024]
MWRRLLLVFVLAAAGCAEVGKQPKTAAEDAPVPEMQATESSEPKLKNSTLKYLANRNLKPQPTRPLNVRSRCTHKDAIGTQTRLDLLVKEAEVKTFVAQVSMKGRGTCRFDLNEFDQVEKMPQALLRHKKQSDCLVRMWEQGPKVTIAFNSCPKSCDGGAFEYLWPIMVEAKSGQCF